MKRCKQLKLMLGQGKAESPFLALNLAFIKQQNTKDTVNGLFNMKLINVDKVSGLMFGKGKTELPKK